MPINRLAHEKSPYLLQHAHNPVDWYAWGDEAFAKARLEDKPIFLSIGYSTCHWCHVMERESFESAEIAGLLNESFVPVKVDREERPDVDRIYMTFVQASTGSGGWPMSVWLTPELKPFFGGTYFPPDNRYGRPGFAQVLRSLAESWKTDRERVVESSEGVVQQLKEMSRVSASGKHALDKGLLDSAFYGFRRTFDTRNGGFGGAPKFPRPSVFNFLLRYGSGNDNEEAKEMTLQSLRAMARGGMNDQLAGGFHRYSVDERWFVPHFEKMLYDQGQLAVSYLEAMQSSGDHAFGETARRVLEYVLRDMTHPQGGFYSAEDADSVIDPDEPHEKGEGAFYIWSAAELRQLLGDRYEWFAYRYGIEEDGNVKEDPQGEFTSRNILFEKHTLEETAAKFGATGEDFATAVETLLARRATRIRPHLDDKVLTGWNALMISAFALGYRVLEDARYLYAARRSADFVLSDMQRGGHLLRRWRGGDAAIEGFLDDYAFFVQALLDLYQACFEPRYLQAAVDLNETMIELFGDPAGGGFYSTPEGDASLVLRMKEDYDGAEPSGNSVAALNLIRLAELTGNERYRELAEQTLQAFATRLQQGAAAVPQMLVALWAWNTPPKQIVISGPLKPALLHEINQRFLPRHTTLTAGELLAEWHPELAAMQPIDGQTTAYVCEDFACKLPVTDVVDFAALLG